MDSSADRGSPKLAEIESDMDAAAMSYDARSYLGSTWFEQPIDPFADPWYRFARLLRELDRSIQVTRETAWLDLGCHQGQFTKLVCAKYGVYATGIDDWDPALKSDSSWRYVQADLSTSFFVGRNHHYVSALEVIEHIVDTDAFLERCREHLVHGGHLLLTTPNINSLRNRLTVPLGRYPAGPEHRTVIHHVRLYNATVLRQHLEAHGFAVRWIRGVNLLPNRALRVGFAKFDGRASNLLPSLCGNLMALAVLR